MSGDDIPQMESTGLTQADQLYRGFPDFSDWGKLSLTDADLWSRFAASLEERRREASPEVLKSAVEVAVRAAALDTGAIEGLYHVDRGFTMTVAMQSLAWEQAVEERGANIRELFEAQLEAYEVVLDAATHLRPITEAWIRTLHQVLCAPQKTYRVLTDMGWQEHELPKGQYKTRPNHVRLTDGTLHAYAPVDQVSSEMHRLLEQIRTPEFEAAHTVLQASYCHYAFVVIHPFADGNGRVARALASAFFYRAQSIPLVVFENQRPTYLESLRAADLEDFRPLVSFFLDRGIDTMQLVSESLMTAGESEIRNFVKNFLSPHETKEQLSSEEAINLALRILAAALQEVRSQAGEVGLPYDISYVAFNKSDWDPAPTPYRELPNDPYFGARAILFTQDRRKDAALSIRVLIKRNSGHLFSFAIQAQSSSDLLEIRIGDVSPEFSASFKIRLSQWVRRSLLETLKKLGDISRKQI